MSVANQRQVFLFKLCSFGINLVTFAKFVVKIISVASNIKKSGIARLCWFTKIGLRNYFGNKKFFLKF